MGSASGLGSQWGFVAETTYATRVAPTRYLPFNSESLQLQRPHIVSRGIRRNRVIGHTWAQSVQSVTGSIEFELAPQGSALVWKHALGACTTSGTTTYTHTCTPLVGGLDGLSWTTQVCRPDITGTDRVFEYPGSVVTGWSLGGNVGEFVLMSLDLYAQHEDTSQSLATASYPATYELFTYDEATLTVAGSAYDVASFLLQGDNALQVDRHKMQATTPYKPKRPLEAGMRSYTGTVSGDFADLTAYNRYVAGTEAALVITLNGGTGKTCTLTTNVRFTGSTPTVQGMDLLTQELAFECTSATSDATALTVVVVNQDSAP